MVDIKWTEKVKVFNSIINIKIELLSDKKYLINSRKSTLLAKWSKWNIDIFCSVKTRVEDANCSASFPAKDIVKYWYGECVVWKSLEVMNYNSFFWLKNKRFQKCFDFINVLKRDKIVQSIKSCTVLLPVGRNYVYRINFLILYQTVWYIHIYTYPFASKDEIFRYYYIWNVRTCVFHKECNTNDM